MDTHTRMYKKTGWKKYIPKVVTCSLEKGAENFTSIILFLYNKKYLQ